MLFVKITFFFQNVLLKIWIKGVRHKISLILTITDGTNPNILIDYNDSSQLDEISNALINSKYIFNHIFPNSGYYDVNITVFNLVSSVSKIIRVIHKILYLLFIV